jgi:hypothetical protein
LTFRRDVKIIGEGGELLVVEAFQGPREFQKGA